MTTERSPDPGQDQAPILITPGALWLLVAAALVALAVLGWVAPDAMRMLLGGVAIALFLSFPVRHLARVMPRGLAVAVTIIGLVGLGLIALVAVVPTLVQQLSATVDALPRMGDAVDGLLRHLSRMLQERGLTDTQADGALDWVNDKVTGKLEDSLEDIANGLLSGFSDTFSSLFQLFGMLFVAGYLLADAGRLKAAAIGMAPERYRRNVEELLGRIGRSLSRYLAALVASAVIQGTLATLALWVIGVPNALLLGVVLGLTSALPFAGVWLAAIPAVATALTQSPVAAVLTAGAYLGISQLDRYVVSPYLHGRALRVSPLLSFLAVVAGWQIAGALGAVLALPLVGVLRVLFDYLIEAARRAPAGPADGSVSSAHHGKRGWVGGAAPLVNLNMSVVVLPEKSANIQSAKRFDLQVGDTTFSRQQNALLLKEEG